MLTEKERAEIERAAIESCLDAGISSGNTCAPAYETGFEMGVEYALAKLRPDASGLTAALKAWLAWEAEQIREQGPYVGKEINALIEQGRAALKDYERAKGET